MKKLLSFIVAMALVLSTMSVSVFAAVSDDVTDANVKAAVDRLVAFKLVSGMEDGKFHPEQKLTREQAAKLIVEALGLGSAANAAMGATQFSDVAADRWSSGYINVAAGQGIVKGVGNGMFAPDAEVPYSQVITMLVRALGYKDEFLPGSWPGNYVAKAADVNIDNGVTFTPDGIADRGSVAVMLNNTLNAYVVKITSYDEGSSKTVWQVLDGTNNNPKRILLKDKLDINKIEDVRLTKNFRLDSGLKTNQVDFGYSDPASAKLTLNGNDGTTSDIKASACEIDPSYTVDVEKYLGTQVVAYQKDNKLVYMEPDESKEVVTDMVSKIDGTKTKLKVKDTSYTVNNLANVYVNGNPAVLGTNAYTSQSNTVLKPGLFGRFVIDNGSIVWADLFDGTGTDSNFQKYAFVVTSVDSTNNIITGLDGTQKDVSVNIKDDFDNNPWVFAADRTQMKFADIKAGDVLYILKQTIGGKKYAIITDVNNNVVEGSLSKYGQDYAYIADKKYDVSNYTAIGSLSGSAIVVGSENAASATFDIAYTPNNYSDIYDYSSGSNSYTASSSSMEDVSGNSVKAYTDIVGMVRFFAADVKATSGDLYGIVTKTYADNEKIKIWTKNADGNADEFSYNVAKSDDLIHSLGKDAAGNRLGGAVSAGDLVWFKLDKDGQIADGKFSVIGASVNGKYDYVGTIKADGSNGTDGKTGKTNFYAATASAIVAGTSMQAGSVATFGTNAGTNYKITDSTLFIAAPNVYTSNAAINTDNYQTLNWADVKDKSLNASTDPVAIFGNDKGEAKAVFFLTTFSGGSDPEGAYVVAKFKDGDKNMATVKMFGDSAAKDIEIDNSNTGYDSLSKESVVTAKTLGSGKLRVFTATGNTFNNYGGDTVNGVFTTVTGYVYAKDGNSIELTTDGTTVLNGLWYLLDSATVYYNGGDVKSISNLTASTLTSNGVPAGTKVTILVKNGTAVRAVKIY